MARKPAHTARTTRRSKRGDAASNPPTQAGVQSDRKQRKTVYAVILVSVVTLFGVTAVVQTARSRIETVVVPMNPERLDPRVRAYVLRHVSWAREAPNETNRHATLGLVYAANGCWSEALASFQTASRLGSGDELPDYYAAIATQKLGDPDTTVTMLKALTQTYPSFAPAHHRLADLLLEGGRRDQAARAFERAVALAPNEAAGYVGLADVRIRERDHAHALELLRKAIELDPSNRSAHYLLGLAYRGLGRTAEAEVELKRGANADRRTMRDAWSSALSTHNKSASHQVRAAQALLQASRPADAAKVLEETLAWHPDNTEILNNLAIAKLGLKQTQEALDLLYRAERVDPGKAATPTNLAACMLQLGRLDQALAYADRAVELAPTIAQVHITRAKVLVGLRRHAEAIDALEEAVRLDAKDAIVLTDLATLCVALNRLDEALSHMQKVIALNSSSVAAHLRLGDVCIRLGAWEQAEAALVQAQRLSPGDPRVAAMEDRLDRRADH